jgi:endonuclease YncB( thermonuclease family)
MRCSGPATGLPWKPLLAALIAGWAAGAEAQAGPESQLEGEVVEVIDGDSLTLLAAGSRIAIRLAQIDAPELDQPYGPESKAALTGLAAGRTARVTVVGLDRYGRSVGEVYVGGLHLNAEMVRRGHAWAYTRYARTLDIIDLEDEARRAERGIWALPESQRDAPWVWRHRERRATPDPGELRCGEKSTCREMASCAEARFHFETCGLTRLDGDDDGVPCEELCRPRR